MDRTLQSALEKRSRVGSWQSRVYRLERGYLSAWSDVGSAAAKEEPGRTDCLFQGSQVATLSDQGDRRFKLDFPWDGGKTLQLRSSDPVMKESWMSLLRETLEEAKSQIRATGSVFAYGGASKHAQDEAYEEAAYLKTNRFLAAYVVDEQSRASYVNDLLNEKFHHVGDRAGGVGHVLQACAGARAAIAELLALVEDFREEMQGVEELRRGRRDGETQSCDLDPAVAAPKIQRFCEEHMSLVGRTIASRLMLELSPFMDHSVAGTSAAPTDSSRGELVATRRRLDEAYASTDELIVMGTRTWFMDIRDGFLDCEGLERASQAPPTPPPEMATQTVEIDDPTEMTVNPPQPVPDAPTTPTEAGVRRPSLKAFAQVSSAFSAARAASREGASRVTNSLSAMGRGVVDTPVTGLGASATDEKDSASGQAERDARGKKSMLISGVPMSIPGVFKRASRTATGEQEPTGSANLEGRHSPPLSPRKSGSGGGRDDHASRRGEDRFGSQPGSVEAGSTAALGGGGDTKLSKLSQLPKDGESERLHPFGRSSPSSKTSPYGREPLAHDSHGNSDKGTLPPAKVGGANGAGVRSFGGSNNAGATAAAVGSATANASLLPSAAAGSGGRKEKRAFAGGIWNGGGSSAAGSGAKSAQAVERDSKNEPVAAATTADSTEAAAVGGGSHAVLAPSSSSAEAVKPKPSGGKRRFAGGGFSGPPPPASAAPSLSSETPAPPSGRRDSDNPFGNSSAASQAARSRAEPRNPPPPREAEPAVPAWAAESIPAWAAEPSGGDFAGAAGKTGTGQGATSTVGVDACRTSDGFGLAPPSRPGKGEQVASKKSPYMRVESEAPPARRPSQRRQGESGSRRAFGGGERLF